MNVGDEMELFTTLEVLKGTAQPPVHVHDALSEATVEPLIAGNKSIINR